MVGNWYWLRECPQSEYEVRLSCIVYRVAARCADYAPRLSPPPAVARGRSGVARRPLAQSTHLPASVLPRLQPDRIRVGAAETVRSPLRTSRGQRAPPRCQAREASRYQDPLSEVVRSLRLPWSTQVISGVKPPSMLTSCGTWSGRTSLWSVSDASTRALIAAVTRAVALSLPAIRRAPSRYAVGRDSVGGRREAKFRAIAAAGAFIAYHGMPRPGYAGHSCTLRAQRRRQRA